MKKIARIGVVLLVAGICLAALGWALGGSFSYKVNPKTHEFSKYGDEDYYAEDSLSLDAFKALDIEVGVADIDIKEGDSWHLDYVMYGEDKPTVSNQGDTLEIKSKADEAYVHIGFDFRIFEFAWKSDSKQPRLRLTVPKGSRLSDVTIFTESGDCRLSNIVAERISVKSEAGDIILTDTDCSEMDMTLESGDAKIKACDLDSCKLLSESGDVTVTDLNCLALDMTLESGDARVSEGDLDSWKLLSESGDVKAEEVAVHSLDAKAESGDVQLSLKGNKDDYGFDLFCDSGDLRLDGAYQGSRFIYGEDKKELIKVENESGDVEVAFK